MGGTDRQGQPVSQRNGAGGYRRLAARLGQSRNTQQHGAWAFGGT